MWLVVYFVRAEGEGIQGTIQGRHEDLDFLHPFYKPNAKSSDAVLTNSVSSHQNLHLSMCRRISSAALAVALILLLQQPHPAAAQPLTILAWDSTNSTGCLPDDSYDACATLEFCEGPGRDEYGYRVPGFSNDCGLYTAPLIRFEAGQKYLLTLRNTASEATNLHTHGLHISGDGNADDVTRCAAPNGGTLQYTYNIGSFHRGGTFWYHSHLHHATRRQVQGGALGMVVVEDGDGNFDIEDDSIRAFATDPQYELHLIAVGIIRDGGRGEEDRLEQVFGNGIPSPGPNFEIQGGIWYRFRILSASSEARRVDLQVQGDSCVTRLVASDGIWRSLVPAPAQSSFTMTGASRIDLAMMCDPGSSTAITYEGEVVATIDAVQDKGVSLDQTLPSPFDAEGSTWTSRSNLPEEHYLQDLRSVSVDDDMEIRVDRDSINRMVWNPEEYLTALRYNTVHEWELIDTDRHPFHLHIFPMQIVTPGGCGHQEEGEFYDVVSTSSDDPCTVRFRTVDIAGRIVLHCHVLEHEDLGSMTWIQVEDGPAVDYSNMEEPGGTCMASSAVWPAPPSSVITFSAFIAAAVLVSLALVR